MINSNTTIARLEDVQKIYRMGNQEVKALAGVSISSEHLPLKGLQVWVFDKSMSPEATDSPPGRGEGWVTRAETVSDSATHPSLVRILQFRRQVER